MPIQLPHLWSTKIAAGAQSVQVLSWALLAVLFCTSGCDYFSNNEVEVAIDEPDWVNTDGDETKSVSDLTSGDDGSSRANLELQLKPGERFGMRKVVETKLEQNSPDGTRQTVHSDLTMTLGLTVEDVKDGQTKLAVRYNRVQVLQRDDEHLYSHDSQNHLPGTPVPIGYRAYHNMVGDGFSFWIGKENQIEKVEGFKDFLERCLSDIPEEQRKLVLLNMEAAADENGLSDFVDNTIGLLPYGRAIAPGEEWEQTRHVGRPVPMHIMTKYTLKDLTADSAVVDIRGEITQSISTNDPTARVGGSVIVNGGTLRGECSIYRDSGLPQRSRVERVVNMSVVLAGGHTFDQRKTVTTTVESYPSKVGDSQPVLLGEKPLQTGDVVPASNREVQ